MDRSLLIPSTNAWYSNKEKNNNFHESRNCPAALGLNHQKKNLATDSKCYFPSVAKCVLHCTDTHETRTVHQHYLQNFSNEFHHYRTRNVEIMCRNVFTYLSITLTVLIGYINKYTVVFRLIHLNTPFVLHLLPINHKTKNSFSSSHVYSYC
jgi:hypothetical protein